MMQQRYISLGPVIKDVANRKRKEQLYAEIQANNYGYLEIAKRAAMLGLSGDPDVNQLIRTKQMEAQRQSSMRENVQQQARQQQLGSRVQELTTPQWQPTGVEQPQTMLGQGPVAKAVQESGMGGFITGETAPPQAQTPVQLESQLASEGYGAEERKPFVSTMQAQQKEQRLAQQQATTQNQAQQKLQQAERKLQLSENKFREYQRAQKEKDAQARKTQMLKAYREHPSVDETTEIVEMYDRAIKNAERRIQIYKEQGSHTLEALSKGELKRYKEALNKAKKTLEQAEYIQKSLQSFSSGGTSAPPTGIGESTFEMDGVEYSY